MAIKITVNNTQNSASDADCEALEKALAGSKGAGLTDQMAKEAICCLCQIGGTNNAAGNLSVTLEDPAAAPPINVKVTLKEVKDIIKINNLKFTLRQYARNRSQEIHDFGKMHNIPGDLAKKLNHMFGPISTEDSYWCSSFQMDSPVCPQNIKDLLIKHYDTMFKKK